MHSSSQTAVAVLAIKRAIFYAALVAVLFMAGCALTPTQERGAQVVTHPDTPAEYVLSVTSLYAWVGSTTARLLNDGTITIERAQDVQHYLNEIRPRLDAARATVADVIECHADGVPVCQSLENSLTMQLLKDFRGELLEYQRELQQEMSP